MIVPKINAKVVFFNRSVIRSNWRRMNRHPMTKTGMLVRRIARGSIRRGKKGGKPAARGRPPKSRLSGKSPPFKMIYSVPKGAKVIVGMVGFTRKGQPVPGLHEHGGRARRRVITQQTQERDRKGRFLRYRTTRRAKVVRYPKRPFMQPALQRAAPRLPRLWRGSLGR